MNELHELHELFAASVGAAAALIGLLFVAVSVAPERVFGEAAKTESRADAERAFTALGNVFFVSLVALLVHGTRGAILVIAVIALVGTVRVGLASFRKDPDWRNIGLISLAIYAFELVTAYRLNTNAAAAETLVWIVVGLYSYALGVSWKLLGSRT